MNYGRCEIDDYTPDKSAWRAKPGRHPMDDVLRKKGFAILSRPKAGPVLWTRLGVVFTQAEAETFTAKDPS